MTEAEAVAGLLLVAAFALAGVGYYGTFRYQHSLGFRNAALAGVGTFGGIGCGVASALIIYG